MTVCLSIPIASGEWECCVPCADFDLRAFLPMGKSQAGMGSITARGTTWVVACMFLKSIPF